MSLKDKRIKSEYRSLIDNVVQDFYIPLLHESTSYKRAVVFFSSSALVEISKGIADMAKDGGKIEIVASPYLSDDDIIKEMYNMTQDSYEREFLKPIYEWTLFRSIMWWVDAIEGSSLDEIPREYCIDESGVDRYDFINDVENYIDFLFADWDFLNLSVIYSLYKKKPQVLKKFLHIDIEHYLELMPPDIEMDCKRMIEKNKKIKESKNSMIININSGQINISQGNSKLNATQNNGTSGDELEKIIEEIRESLHNLNKEDAEKISDVIELAQQELVKSKPKVSRLRNCLTMFAPMFTIANGIPTLTDNLHKLQEIIMSYIK